MIRNQWYVFLESKEAGRKPVGVTRMGEKLVFWRVVVTHRAQASSMDLGEKLIQGDLPIIEFRRKRAELQRSALQ